MLVTLWYRQSKNDQKELVWDFNHLEDGWDDNATYPTPKTPEQTSWSKASWKKEKAELINNVVNRV
jgi:hypothetical protein